MKHLADGIVCKLAPHSNCSCLKSDSSLSTVLSPVLIEWQWSCQLALPHTHIRRRRVWTVNN